MEYDNLDFHNTLLVPRYTTIKSREEVNLTTYIKLVDNTFFELALPVIASPMRGIVGTELLTKLYRLGGIGILHRFHDERSMKIENMRYLEKEKVCYGVAISLSELEDISKDLKSYHYKYLRIICIDVANGYTKAVLDTVKELRAFLRTNNYRVAIMAGNVVSSQGVDNLRRAGATMYRVGIGSGALCTTRLQTGVGYPQLSAILESSNGGGVPGIIADGGIKSYGDIAKALAAGADFVMAGSMFAKTFESENNGTIYGMASRKLQEEFYGDVKSIEGIEKEESKDISLVDLIKQIEWCLKSSCTYLDSLDLVELKRKARFVKTD